MNFREQGMADGLQAFERLKTAKTAEALERMRQAEHAKFESFARSLDGTDAEVGEYLTAFRDALQLAAMQAEGRA